MKSIVFITIIIVITFILNLPAHAQSSTCSSVGGQLRTEGGLVSTPQGNTFSTTSGVCVIDPKAAFAPFKIPSYNDLKSLYFTQSKDTSHKQEIPSLTSLSDQMLYHASGSLTIGSPPLTYSGTSLVFVDRDLTINGNITGSATGGLVLVVGGDVNIHQNVDQIDAVIISSGTICTAYNGTSCSLQNIETEQLVINGSLISINEESPIKFRRSLLVNTEPAEKINHQVKYLVILRDTFSDTLQRWSEIQ